jgi:hypothetical protein
MELRALFMYRRSWGIVVLVAGLLLLLVGCDQGVSNVEQAATPPIRSPQGTPTTVPQLSYDAFIDATGQLDRVLKVQEEATYAGLCVTRPGRREATLAFTADAEETAREYLDGHPLAAYVQARTAEYPAALLDANARTEVERIYNLGFDARGGVDYCRNHIVITVLAPREVEATLAANGVQLPEYVELVAGSMITPEA